MVEAHAVPGPARDRILEAAERVVAEVGAARLTLDVVAQAAGVSKGGLLYHFPSKESLLGALAQRYVQSMEHCIEAREGSASANRTRAAISRRASSGFSAAIRARRRWARRCSPPRRTT